MRQTQLSTSSFFGYIVGYCIAYTIFSTLLYFALKLSGKLPADWIYFHVLGLTAAIIVLSLIVRKTIT